MISILCYWCVFLSVLCSKDSFEIKLSNVNINYIDAPDDVYIDAAKLSEMLYRKVQWSQKQNVINKIESLCVT